MPASAEAHGSMDGATGVRRCRYAGQRLLFPYISWEGAFLALSLPWNGNSQEQPRCQVCVYRGEGGMEVLGGAGRVSGQLQDPTRLRIW